MNKYYVTWGQRQFIVNSGNEISACITAMNIAFANYIDVVGTMFRVSQRGHEHHEDDFIISLDEVIQLQILANNYEE